MIPVQVGRGAVAEFVCARLAEDEADPDRYGDPAWGRRLVVVLRYLIATDPSPDTYRRVAAVWSDHPCYRSAWKP